MTDPQIWMLRWVTGAALIIGCVSAAISGDDVSASSIGQTHGPRVEAAAPLSLDEARALALMGNPELEAFSWEVRSREAKALQAGQPPNPELDVRLTRLDIPQSSQPREDGRWRVLYSQELELGGKGRRRHDLARTERDLAEWDYRAKRDEVTARVAGRFTAVLGAQRRVELLRESVDFFEGLREKVSLLVESGALGSLAMHDIKSRAGLARIDLQQAEYQLEAARFGLAAQWGNDSPRFTEALGNLERTHEIPSLETVLELARQTPAVARWEAERARAEAALALGKAGRIPDVTTGAGLRWEENTDERDYLFDVEITLPILDRKRGEIRAARFDMRRAEAGGRAAEIVTNERIVERYYELAHSNSRKRTLFDDVLPAVRASFEAYRRVLESQSASLRDLLDARRDLAQAEIEYTEALVDWHTSFAALEAIVGEALPRAAGIAR